MRAKNAHRRPEVQLELKAMRSLPRFRTTDFSLATVIVTRSGTISIRGVLYTVLSRLVGCRLKVHIYDDWLSCWLGTTQVLVPARPVHPDHRCTVDNIRGSRASGRGWRHYRHTPLAGRVVNALDPVTLFQALIGGSVVVLWRANHG